MEQMRKRLPGEQVRVGDVVQVLPGAFGSGIVTKTYLSEPSKESWCIVERAHLSTGMVLGDDKTIPWARSAQIQIGVERIDMPEDRVRDLPVYVTGASGGFDNRSER